MGYFVCAVDSDGDRLVGTEEELSPGPAELEYPTTPAGSILETGNGRLIKQQPTSDPRQRAWLWKGLPTGPLGSPWDRYTTLVSRLESLVSRTRREQGLSPYVYLRDTSSNGFRVFEYVSGTATAVSSLTLADNTKNWGVNRWDSGATIEIVDGAGEGQRRSIVSNTATVLTLSAPWTTTPTGAGYVLQGSRNDWVRVRVLEVSKRFSGRSSIQLDPVRMSFTVEDLAFNDLG